MACYFLLLISLEGLPPTIEYSGKSLHSTQPPAMMLPFFIVRPGIIKTWHPIHTSSSMTVRFLSEFPCLQIGISVLSNLWLRSSMVTFGPIMTSLPTVRLLGTQQLIPNPELSPMDISLPVPKYAPRSMLTFFPQNLKIFLQHEYLNFLPNSWRGR